jgi:hypothetical protein
VGLQPAQSDKAKKSPLDLERAESISGGDMEETRITIHAALMRRNNFLRENPNFFWGQLIPGIWDISALPSA